MRVTIAVESNDIENGCQSSGFTGCMITLSWYYPAVVHNNYVIGKSYYYYLN